MYSTSLSFVRIAQQALALVVCAGAILALTPGPVLAGHGGGVTVTSADWNGTTLSAQGTAERTKGNTGPVLLFDADTNTQIGTDTSVGKDHLWAISTAFCAATVYASQDGNQSSNFAVTGTACGNQAPILDPIGDRSVIEGADLVFTVTTQPDPDGPNFPLVLTVSNNPAGSSFLDNLDGTGTFTWLEAGPVGSYPNVTFTANDGEETDSESITITVDEIIPPGEFPTQTDFKILMNYELGMHCTGFEFAYCCVLPAYNSILAQVVKPNTNDPNHGGDFARLLEGDPNAGIAGNGANPDVLGREIVLRDLELDDNGDFKKYVMRYWHDAQPRNDGRGKPQSSTLISQVEGNSLLSWNTVADAADLNPDGSFKLSGAPLHPDDPDCDPDPVAVPPRLPQ